LTGSGVSLNRAPGFEIAAKHIGQGSE